MVEEYKSFLAKLLDVNNIEDNTHVRKIIENIKILYNDKGLLNSIINELPLDGRGIPIPWYTYPIIDYLNQLDFSKCSALEFGSGYSTIFWSNVAHKVFCIERNKQWYSIVLKKLKRDNVEILLIEDSEKYVEFLKSICIKRFDIVIIDGRDRFRTVTYAHHALKSGGVLIFDNSDWYPASCSFLRKKKYTQVDFCGFGPINNYTWCTSIFFKKAIKIPHKKRMNFVGRRKVIKEDDAFSKL
jgi:protein-L-isoaspartate O-methyltransferase